MTLYRYDVIETWRQIDISHRDTMTSERECHERLTYRSSHAGFSFCMRLLCSSVCLVLSASDMFKFLSFCASKCEVTRVCPSVRLSICPCTVLHLSCTCPRGQFNVSLSLSVCLSVCLSVLLSFLSEVCSRHGLDEEWWRTTN